MQNLPIFYQGASIALMFRVRDQANHALMDLQQFDIEAILFTRMQGEKIKLSTTDPDKIPLFSLDINTLAANIPSQATFSFPTGICSVQLELTHRQSRAKLITTTRIMIVRHSI